MTTEEVEKSASKSSASLGSSPSPRTSSRNRAEPRCRGAFPSNLASAVVESRHLN